MSAEAPLQSVLQSLLGQDSQSNVKQISSGPRRRRPAKPNLQEHATSDAGPSTLKGKAGKPSKPKRPRPPQDANAQGGSTPQGGPQPEGSVSGNSSSAKPKKNNQRSQNRNKSPDGKPSTPSAISTSGDPSATAPPRPRPQRKPKPGSNFNSNLTEDEPRCQPKPTNQGSANTARKYRQALPQGDDLTSRLIRDISTPPWPDCLICFYAIHRDQPTWSCSPLIPISSASDDEKDRSPDLHRAAESAQFCWTTFHLKCVRPWASKSVKDTEEAWRIREIERKGEWRCPGCQARREVVPTSYW